MRIVFFSDNFYPEMGGIQDSISDSIRELAARNHEILVFAPKASVKDFAVAGLRPKELDLGPRVAIRRIFAVPYPSPTMQSRAVIPIALPLRSVRAFNPDVIHTHTFFGAGIEALLTSKILRIPLVGTNHWAIKAFALYSPVGRAFFEKYSVRFVSWYYGHCNYVTAPSRSVLDEMRAAGFRARCESVSNPIDTATFHPIPETHKAALKKKFHLGGMSIVFAGRLAVEKNIDVVIRALPIVKKRFPAITFAMAGHGSGKEELARLAKELGVEAHLRFPGTLDKPTLAELYGASEIFTIASTSETQSMVLLQAMACGIPAIGVASRSLPEYIPSSAGFIVPPGDHRAFAEKIIHLLARKPLQKKFGAAARIFAEQFSVSRIATKWENIYEKVARAYKEKQQ